MPRFLFLKRKDPVFCVCMNLNFLNVKRLSGPSKSWRATVWRITPSACPTFWTWRAARTRVTRDPRLSVGRPEEAEGCASLTPPTPGPWGACRELTTHTMSSRWDCSSPRNLWEPSLAKKDSPSRTSPSRASPSEYRWHCDSCVILGPSCEVNSHYCVILPRSCKEKSDSCLKMTLNCKMQ